MLLLLLMKCFGVQLEFLYVGENGRTNGARDLGLGVCPPHVTVMGGVRGKSLAAVFAL